MKKLVTFFATLAIAAVFFVSCGGDDAKKLTPEEQFKTALSKYFVDNSKLFADGLSQIKNTVNLSNYGEDLVIGVEVGDAAQTLINAALSESDLNLDTKWLKNVQVGVTAGLTDNAMQFNVKAGLNKTDIVSVNVYEDSTNKTIYFSIPELIKNNFKISEDEFGVSVRQLMNDYLAQVSFMSSVPEQAVFTGFIEELVNALVTSVGTVERTSEEIKAGMNGGKEVSSKYTVLSVKLNENFGSKFGSAVQNVIKTSSNFNEIANWVVPVLSKLNGRKIRVKEFTDGLAEALEDEIDDLFYYNETELVLKLYVDSQSNIAGTSLVIEDEGTINVLMPQNGKNFGFALNVVENGESPIVAWNGYGTYANGKMTGDFKLFVEGEEAVAFETKDLDITSLKSVKANGAITIHPKAEMRDASKDFLEDEFDIDYDMLSFFDNLDFTISMSQKDYNSASAELALTNGNSNFLSLTAKNTVSKPTAIKMPASDIFELNEDSIENYEDILDGITTSQIVENLKKAKVAPEYLEPIESLTGEMLGELVEDYFDSKSNSYNYYDDYYNYNDDYYDDYYDSYYDDYWW